MQQQQQQQQHQVADENDDDPDYEHKYVNKETDNNIESKNSHCYNIYIYTMFTTYVGTKLIPNLRFQKNTRKI